MAEANACVDQHIGNTHMSAHPHLPVGRHFMVEMSGCADRRLLDDGHRLALRLQQIVEKAGATVVRSVVHQFEGQGATVLLVLAESHAALSTWPEHGSLMVDVFTCGESLDENLVLAQLKRAFSPVWFTTRTIDRRA